jgi:hypothetical protein
MYIVHRCSHGVPATPLIERDQCTLHIRRECVIQELRCDIDSPQARHLVNVSEGFVGEPPGGKDLKFRYQKLTYTVEPPLVDTSARRTPLY